jgi:hypothetical protein
MRSLPYKPLVVLTTVSSALILGSCHKYCPNPRQIEFPSEPSSYVNPMQMGSWWTFISDQGDMDSLYLSAYQENRQSSREERNDECLYLPRRTFTLRSSRHGALFINASFWTISRDASSFSLRADNNGTISTLDWTYSVSEGFSIAELMDTTVAGVTYMHALVLSSNDTRPNALVSIVISKDIGPVCYSIGTTSFLLTNYSIP